MNCTYKFRLHPNQKQQEKINETITGMSLTKGPMRSTSTMKSICMGCSISLLS